MQRFGPAVNLYEVVRKHGLRFLLRNMSIKNIARLGIMATVLAAVLSSCSKGNNDPYPNKGDNGETESGITEGFSASVTYCGDWYDTGFHDYVIVLQSGKVDDENMFVNGGIELSLDVLTAQGGATYFPNGTYTLLPKDTKFNAAGIVPSIEETDEDGNISFGYTYVYTEKDANNYWLDPLDDARLEVSSSGSEYTIKVDFTVGTEKYTYKYKGNLAFYTIEDNGDDDSGDIVLPTGDIEFGAGYVEAYNYGDAFENGADDFMLYLDHGDETEYIQIEFTNPSSGDRTTLPVGEWTIPSNFFDVEEIATDILLPYFYFEGYEEYTQGTAYCYDNYLVYGATSGTLKVTKSGDEYNIELLFTDSESNNAEVLCKYTGPVVVDASYYYDESESTALSKKAHGKKATLKTVKRINAHNCEKAKKSTRSAVRTK